MSLSVADGRRDGKQLLEYSSTLKGKVSSSDMRSALVLAVATVAGGFVSHATTRTGHLGVRLLVPMTAAPALALRSIPLVRSSPTSHRCSPTSMGPPDRSGRRLGGRQPDEQPPAARPRTDEERVALSRADELPATLLPEPTPVSVIAIAGGGLLACVLAAMMLLGSGSSDSYYYSSSFEQVTVTSRGEDGQPRVETRQQRSVKTNIPQRALGETGVNAITGY